jgi:hypothetical protein
MPRNALPSAAGRLFRAGFIGNLSADDVGYVISRCQNEKSYSSAENNVLLPFFD